jgi:hypothetical protein
MSLLAAIFWSGFGFLYVAAIVRIMTIALKAVSPARRPLWVLASLPFLAPLALPIYVLVSAEESALTYLGILIGGLVGLPLGWFAGAAFRALPTKPVRYYARHRGRRQYRHLRGPESDPKPPGLNPFIENDLQPPETPDGNNPFKDLKLGDDPAGERSANP